MSILKTSLLIALATAALLAAGCRGTNPKNEDRTLRADKRVEMVTKAEGEQKPLFHAVLKFKNPDGTDAEDVKLHPNPDDLKKAIKIKIGKKTVTPYYVATSAQESDGGAQSIVNNDILLLFDVSGSMNSNDIQPTRFAAAKSAATELVKGLPPNYRVAVVPFESRKVQDQFDKAQFHSPQEAVADIGNLPPPDNHGNTALYSAMDKALEVLKKRKDDGQSQDQSLIVLTDGKNDVGHPGDDRGLLDKEGYQMVLTKLRNYNTRTFTIGLGKPNKGDKSDLGFEDDKLKALASTQGETRYYQADNLDRLKANFAAVQKSVKNTVAIGFCTDDKNLHDLRSLKFEIGYVSLNSKIFKGVIPWVCRNSITGCVPSRAGTLRPNTQEFNDLEKSNCDKETLGPGQQILWLLGQLALFSGGIAVLWMFVPSLIWPSVPLPQLPSRGKQKSAPPPAKPARRASSSSPSGQPDRATPAKPRQRFEETRIHDDPGRHDNPRSRE